MRIKMRAGERRKLARNLQENVFARQLGVVGFLLSLKSLPIVAMILMVVGVSWASNIDTHPGVALALAAPAMVFGSSNIKALRQKKVELVKAQRVMLDKLTTEDRDFNEAEGAKYQENIGALASVEAKLEREEKLLEAERGLSGINTDDLMENAPGAEGKKFADFGEQLIAVMKHTRSNGQVSDPRLKFSAAATGANETVPSEGGFAVQQDFSSEILKSVHETGAIISRCRKVTVSGNGLKINGIDETSRANGSRWGGVQAYWAAEADTVTATKPKFRRIELNLHKLFALGYATDELLEDAAALGQIMKEAFAEELTFKLEDGVVNGTGSGQPLGILASPGLVSIAKETSQVAATIVTENVLKMYARFSARSRMSPGAAWYYNVACEPQLFQLNVKIKNVAGTENVGGFAAPIFFPAGNGSAQHRLLGLPMIPVEQAAALGTQGDLILADNSQYLVIDKGGIKTAESMHVRFLNDEMTFKATYRVDGQPIVSAKLTPFKGTDTTSPFVVLDTRA